MTRLLAVLLFALIAACAVTGATFGNSPEAQIVTGANAVTAAATLSFTLLKNDKISTAQAKSYSAILHTAGNHLDETNAELLACRKRTASTNTTKPDPCAAGIADDIKLALSVVSEVQKTLEARK